jgi:hypothetical protein
LWAQHEWERSGGRARIITPAPKHALPQRRE